MTKITREVLTKIEREFVDKADGLDGGWDWANDHGPDLIAELGRHINLADELRDQLKDAFVAGCIEMLNWLHAAMPQDDLDEAGYDYASSVIK